VVRRPVVVFSGGSFGCLRVVYVGGCGGGSGFGSGGVVIGRIFWFRWWLLVSVVSWWWGVCCVGRWCCDGCCGVGR
jgi:hypothetical protein